MVDPVIVIPGVIATYLRDVYPLPPEAVWSVVTKEYERSLSHPENRLYDAILPARVVPDQIYEIAYRELVEDLRHELSPKADQPTPVYPFGYDWRQPLWRIQESLDAFVTEVIERTKLMRHYANSTWNDDPKVNLIGHSMGGLIVAGYLKTRGRSARVRKVVSIAAPFQGSIEAVKKVITGTGSLREREAARLTPSLYHLLPSFASGIEIADPFPKSLFDAGVWQQSVLGSIREALRIYGTGPASGLDAKAQAVLQEMLDEARKHRDSISDPKLLTQAGLTTSDWLCIIGVGEDTRVKVHVDNVGGKPVFHLYDGDVMNQWGEPPPKGYMTGDGTVPFAGAVAPFLNINEAVCLSPMDFELLELKDKGLTALAGLHGIIPNMNLLQRLVVRFLTGARDKYKVTYGSPAPGVTNWKPPLPLGEQG